MICNSCKKEIELDDIKRVTRRGYNVHEHIEDFYCPHCGDEVYPTEDDWEEMTKKDWWRSIVAAKWLSELELRPSIGDDE